MCSELCLSTSGQQPPWCTTNVSQGDELPCKQTSISTFKAQHQHFQTPISHLSRGVSAVAVGVSVSDTMKDISTSRRS
eukprot:2332530-Amphidinium_carterae.2